ncbi:undecaprenyl-phosphate galactose phosphotransferase WbaP [Azospirillum halopraeferens]|uniref:undecaprenyl-phosphate galactose phosphotransferase WbaP n=1 Tax=Azospirillum halopraeferens TaxID=34010 RepID=UPI00146FAAAD|nr:undecaprenyl-phosphate galactose phosphotransferase WbaP [Azospirillum halopraeferens]
MTHPPVAGPQGYRHRLFRLGTVRGVVLVLADVLALASALLAAVLPVLLFGGHGDTLTPVELLGINGPLRVPQMLVLSAVLLIWFYHKGRYGLRLPLWTEMRYVVMGCIGAMLADGFAQYATKGEFSRLWLVHTWLLSVPLLLLYRYMVRRLLSALGLWEIPVLVVGSGVRLDETAALLRADGNLGYSVVGMESLERIRADWRGSWIDVLHRYGADMLVIAGEGAEPDGNRYLVSRLPLERVPFVSVRSPGGLPVIAVDVHYLVGHDVLLLTGQHPLSRPLGHATKLLFDYAAALALLVLLMPVFAVLSVLIARDGGPVLYGHTRIGSNGRPFRCLKFRTMVPDAEAVLARVLDADPERRREWEADHKLRGDPRVTRIGRFLRAYSLDELPQLINVVRGEMSLVGPRPVTRDELERFGEEVAFYLQAKPGITGLWQVSGRNDLDYARRTQLNTWYVTNWSLWIDIVILARTVRTVLSRHGAY